MLHSTLLRSQKISYDTVMQVLFPLLPWKIIKKSFFSDRGACAKMIFFFQAVAKRSQWSEKCVLVVLHLIRHRAQNHLFLLKKERERKLFFFLILFREIWCFQILNVIYLSVSYTHSVAKTIKANRECLKEVKKTRKTIYQTKF